MAFEILTPGGSAISGSDMHGKTLTFTPFSVRYPSFIELRDGTLVYFFFAMYDSQADEAPGRHVLMRSHDGGRTWGETQLLCYDDDPCGDGVGVTPVYDEVHDTLLLFRRTRHWKPGFKENHRLNEYDQILGRTYERFWMSRSTDGGLTWTDFEEFFIDHTPKDWTIQHNGTPGTGIQLKHQKDPDRNGRLIMPCNHTRQNNGTTECLAHLLLSDDFGVSWRIGAVENYAGANESMAAELSDGTIVYNCRNQGGVPENLRIQGFSPDGGETLIDNGVVDTLYDPICHAGFAAAVIGGKDYIFFTAPSGQPGDPRKVYSWTIRWGTRHALMLYASSDGGRTYRAIKQVCGEDVFAAYSAVCPTSDGRLLCTWESGPALNQYRDIRYTAFDLEELARLCEEQPHKRNL